MALDKWMHLIVGFTIVTTISLFLPAWVGFTLGVLATLAKDFIWDKWLKKGTFELADIYCGVVGSFIGFWLGFLSQHI